jgi:hypothetical protein
MVRSYWIAPRSTNRAHAAAVLEFLGIRPAGFDHQMGAYIGCEVPFDTMAAFDVGFGCDFRWGFEERRLGLPRGSWRAGRGWLPERRRDPQQLDLQQLDQHRRERDQQHGDREADRTAADQRAVRVGRQEQAVHGSPPGDETPGA